MTTIDEFGVNNDVLLETEAPKPTTRSGLSSVYDQVRAELSKPVNVAETYTLKVRGRDLSLRVKSDLPLEQLEKWRKASAKRRGSDQADTIQLSTYVIAGQTKCLIVDGVDATDDHGDFLSFRHKDVQEALGALDYAGAVKNFCGTDAEILRLSGEILEKCGYGEYDEDDLEDGEDPLA